MLSLSCLSFWLLLVGRLLEPVEPVGDDDDDDDDEDEDSNKEVVGDVIAM